MKLVVIGGDAAGMSAASQARKRIGPGDLEIVVFERGRFTSYSACGIPYWIGGAVDDRDALIARSPAEHRKNGIDVRLRHDVVGIDLDRRFVVARDLADGGEVRESFDHLVYAAGASPVVPDWARVRDAGVFGVQTLEDGDAIHAWLDGSGVRPHPRRAVVIGGGYIGVEMAEAMIQRGLQVTLLEKSPEPMGKTVDPEIGAMVREAISGLGIEIVTNAHVDGVETADGRVRAVVTPGGSLPADIVVMGLGVRPNTSIARDAGLPLGPTGGLRTDLRMRVEGLENVWAAGDCVETRHLITGRPVHVPLGTHANKQGRVAGINIGGGYATFPGVIGTAVTKVCDLEVARTGLTSHEAGQAGYEFVTATVESTSRAGYYPGASAMTVKLIAERRTGLLLGAQIVGRAEAAKRIDALALAVWNKMTVEEMTALDLSYAPPFAPVWDPVLIAARKATDAVHAG
ncbi:flavoprotein oxidoreductase [Paractinoplanes deccanensis]|uniref:Flavoprotein oxidoreductase n=1 Tax=Paractinoplanes deccanensis TaxID=113561 RepID=A0ABQ3YJB0_9ACTN|nr:FAD-dependent oxidoreductase [Actinoplanes deccanensis]GID79890.1 flavoprotein oxidoreductase [Actinoplanes deccanensis]